MRVNKLYQPDIILFMFFGQWKVLTYENGKSTVKKQGLPVILGEGRHSAIDHLPTEINFSGSFNFFIGGQNPYNIYRNMPGEYDSGREIVLDFENIKHGVEIQIVRRGSKMDIVAGVSAVASKLPLWGFQKSEGVRLIIVENEHGATVFDIVEGVPFGKEGHSDHLMDVFESGLPSLPRS